MTVSTLIGNNFSELKVGNKFFWAKDGNDFFQCNKWRQFLQCNKWQRIFQCNKWQKVFSATNGNESSRQPMATNFQCNNWQRIFSATNGNELSVQQMVSTSGAAKTVVISLLVAKIAPGLYLIWKEWRISLQTYGPCWIGANFIPEQSLRGEGRGNHDHCSLVRSPVTAAAFGGLWAIPPLPPCGDFYLRSR